jgi:hypothetical protein
MLQPAPVQTSYIRYMLPGQNGMLASETPWAADTRTVETAAGLPFGRAVSQGVTERGCIIGGSAYVGISRADITIARADVTPALTVDVYPQYDNAGILTMGDLWVLVAAAVVAGNGVHFSATDGKLSAAGGNTIPGARWMTTMATIGGLAVVRIGDIAGV